MQNLIEMQYFPKVSINVVSHKTQMQNHYHFYNLLNGKMAEQRLLTQRDITITISSTKILLKLI